MRAWKKELQNRFSDNNNSKKCILYMLTIFVYICIYLRKKKTFFCKHRIDCIAVDFDFTFYGYLLRLYKIFTILNLFIIIIGFSLSLPCHISSSLIPINAIFKTCLILWKEHTHII